MIYLLWANTVVEGIFALVFLFSPATILKSSDALPVSLARAFGFATLAMASLSLSMALKPASAFADGLIALAVFHGGLTIAQSMSYRSKLAPLPPVIVHGVFFVLFVAFLIHG